MENHPLPDERYKVIFDMLYENLGGDSNSRAHLKIIHADKEGNLSEYLGSITALKDGVKALAAEKKVFQDSTVTGIPIFSRGKMVGGVLLYNHRLFGSISHSMINYLIVELARMGYSTNPTT